MRTQNRKEARDYNSSYNRMGIVAAVVKVIGGYYSSSLV